MSLCQNTSNIESIVLSMFMDTKLPHFWIVHMCVSTYTQIFPESIGWENHDIENSYPILQNSSIVSSLLFDSATKTAWAGSSLMLTYT